jgi:hypothetical protein
MQNLWKQQPACLFEHDQADRLFSINECQSFCPNEIPNLFTCGSSGEIAFRKMDTAVSAGYSGLVRCIAESCP